MKNTKKYKRIPKRCVVPRDLTNGKQAAPKYVTIHFFFSQPHSTISHMRTKEPDPVQIYWWEAIISSLHRRYLLSISISRYHSHKVINHNIYIIKTFRIGKGMACHVKESEGVGLTSSNLLLFLHTLGHVGNGLGSNGSLNIVMVVVLRLLVMRTDLFV